MLLSSNCCQIGDNRKDYSKHMNFDNDHKEEIKFDAALLTHVHIDCCAHIHHLRSDITIYYTEDIKLIMQTLQETGSDDEYPTCKESFKKCHNNVNLVKISTEPTCK